MARAVYLDDMLGMNVKWSTACCECSNDDSKIKYENEKMGDWILQSRYFAKKNSILKLLMALLM